MTSFELRLLARALEWPDTVQRGVQAVMSVADRVRFGRFPADDRELRRALEPPIGVRTDTEILIQLARRMGASLPEGEELLREMDRVVGWNWGRPQPRGLSPAPKPSAAAVPAGFLLDAAPQLFHSGSVTTRSRLLQDLSPTVAVRINPSDARSLGVTRGEVVEISSPHGEVLMRARLDRSVRRGTPIWSVRSARSSVPRHVARAPTSCSARR